MPTLNRVQLDIYVYDGTAGSYTSADKRYTLSKERISTEEYVNFEIAELVRDYLDHTFNDDYTSSAKWVTTRAYLFDNNDVQFASGSPVNNNYIALDGFGYFEDGINPQTSNDCLISNNTIYIPEDTASKLPIFAEGVGKVTIDTTDTQITDNGNSNQKIQYITIPANSSTVKVYDTDDTTLLRTITINNVCEPKYTPYKVTFVNKNGAYQDIHFFKKSVESMSVQDERYKTNTISHSTLTYNTYQGQAERYNVRATKNVELNTGFVNEDFNTAIEELLLSENVWIRWEGKTLPVLANTKSMQYKTSVNDRLINHTLQFEFAYNKINNLR